MPIQVKNHKILQNLLAVPYHKNLIQLICWVAFRYVNHTKPLVITSGYRDGDSGVHGLKPCRGMDIRSYVFDNPAEIVDDINNYFEYDPKRPHLNCALLHDSGSGEHIHLQAMARTVYHKNGRSKQ